MISMIKIITISLLIIFGQAVFIRKQTIKNDDVLGEIIMIEEIRTSDENINNLDLIIENNAALIEEELDYASQLANMMLNSLEGELIEDDVIQNGGTVFNALENLKGVVNEMQKAEHQYLEDVKHQKEEKEKRLIELEQQARADNNTEDKPFQWNLSDESYYENEILKDDSESTSIQVDPIFAEGQEEIHNNQSNLPNQVNEEEAHCSEETITDEDIEEMEQAEVRAWISDDNVLQESDSKTAQNFNTNTQKEKEKETDKVKLPNIGLGPQKSMKLISPPQPLYKDPSIIIGVISLFALIGGLCYYFVRSKMNLRKSTSTILEQKNEILLSNTKKNRDESGNFEKVKIF